MKILKHAALRLAAALAVGASSVAVSTSAAAMVSNPGSLGDAVEALRAISTMRANFVQTDRKGQRMRGVMTLKRPGKIRFQYEKGVPLLIVGDGRALTLIDYGVNQVERWPISNSPLGALLDPRRDVARYGELRATSHPDVISVEVRDPKHPEYGVITMIFMRDQGAPGGWELTNWVAFDAQNNRTTIKLSNHTYGMPVPENTFRWKDPRKGPRR